MSQQLRQAESYDFVKACILDYLELFPRYTSERLSLKQFLHNRHKIYRGYAYYACWEFEGKILKELIKNHFIVGVKISFTEDRNGMLFYATNTSRIERAYLAGLWDNFLRVGVMV